MKKLIRNIKSHKVVSAVLGICLVGVIGVGTGFGIHQAKIANTQKALLLAQDGYIDSDELAQLGDDIALGEEVIAPDGSTVVITRDANGNYVTTTVKDSEGQATGEVVPVPAPVGHSHTWIAHYATREVPHTEVVNHPAVTHREGHTICTKCHNNYEYLGPCHTCGYATPTSVVETTVVDKAAWTEYITTSTVEQYIDYYYCSECGARQ